MATTRLQKRSVVLGMCAALLGASCATDRAKAPPGAPSDAAAEVTAFVSVSLISMKSEEVQPDQTILTKGDRILTVGSAASVAIPPGARRIDGHGKFLIPGLADMHVHLLQGEADFPLYLA